MVFGCLTSLTSTSLRRKDQDTKFIAYYILEGMLKMIMGPKWKKNVLKICSKGQALSFLIMEHKVKPKKRFWREKLASTSFLFKDAL